MVKLHCRYCNSQLTTTFCDLGITPLSNSYLKKKELQEVEKVYPLHVYACDVCGLVQLPEHESPENIFSIYSYFSSYSTSWLEHSKNYVTSVVNKFGLDSNSLVVEVASNDGYLLQYFKGYKIPVLGVEPAKNVAENAIAKGVDTISEFFNADLAKKISSSRGQADLIVANNVLAHVPDINGFVEGMSLLLKRNGVITIEFPHLLKLIEQNQFDTIYHEHYSYLSFFVVKKILENYKLRVFDVEELKTHGGSLRVYACHVDDDIHEERESVSRVINMEKTEGLFDSDVYVKFKDKVKKTKLDILEFLNQIKDKRSKIIAYGAAAKGNTLLNYCEIKGNEIEYVVDINPNKQGMFMPGSHIPIVSPENIMKTKPDYVLILPWNIKDEIMEQLLYIREWGGKFVVPIPELMVI